MYSLFDQDIERFNKMYSLPCNKMPTDLGIQRLKDYKKILIDEVNEIDEIIAMEHPTDRLVALADLLSDLIVFNASEAKRWGLPISDTTRAVMVSNFTKLGLDGKPIIDATGKVQKGPNYAPPEPEIQRILFDPDYDRIDCPEGINCCLDGRCRS